MSTYSALSNSSISSSKNDNIKGLLTKYTFWSELNHDYQKNIDFGNTSLDDFKNILSIEPTQKEYLEKSIVSFYLANQDLSYTREYSQDLLQEKEVKKYESYQHLLSKLSKELLSYILVCSIVEARHARLFHNLKHEYLVFIEEMEGNEESKQLVSTLEAITFKEELLDLLSNKKVYEKLKTYDLGQKFLENKFSWYTSLNKNFNETDKFLLFVLNIRDNIIPIMKNNDRHSGYSQTYDKVFDLLEDYNLEECFKNLRRLFSFNHSDVFSDHYGGKPWADIAEHGLNFVTGKINAEMFIDQAFSLEHNNGNMFNKDFLYKNFPHFTVTIMESDNSAFGKYAQRNSHYVKINTTQLLLNAQHLGYLSTLFSLEKVLPYLREDISEIEMNGLHDTYSILEPNSNYDFVTFSHHYNNSIRVFKIIQESLEPLKKEVLELYPDLIQESFEPCDFKKLFYSLTQNTRTLGIFHSIIEKATNPYDKKIKGGYFDLINFLYNNVAGHQISYNNLYQSNIEMDQNINLLNYINTYNIDRVLSPEVFNIKDLSSEFANKNNLGSKGLGLVHMTQMNLPVPSAYIFNTDFCHAYYENKEKIQELIQENVSNILPSLTNKFGEHRLCSVRSGAPVSMPGMMDTILNVGIDNTNYHYFCDTLGYDVTHNCVNKFMELFCSSRLGVKIELNSKNLSINLYEFSSILKQNGIAIEESVFNFPYFPLTKERQIEESLYAVFDSWHSERAVSYRIEKGISHNLGTAAIIQQMVFGNLNENSCTGVVFSRNCLTGENQLVGEFLPKAQGEDVVSGSRTPYDISKLKFSQPNIYQQLENIAKQLEEKTKQIQDIEFTVEDGKLYILQHRQAVCSPIAILKLLNENSDSNKQSHNLDTDSLLKQLDNSVFKNTSMIETTNEPSHVGLSANSGVLQGMIITTQTRMQKHTEKFNLLKEKHPDLVWILYAQLTSPGHMPIMSQTQGFITEQGGFTSHAAIIARSLNKPCIVGLGKDYPDRFEDGDIITIDGGTGKIWNGIENIVHNDMSASQAIATVITSKNIDLKSLEKSIENNMGKKNAWMLQLEHAKIINNSPINTSKFFDLSAKVAMVITKESHNESLVIKEISSNSYLDKIKILRSDREKENSFNNLII